MAECSENGSNGAVASRETVIAEVVFKAGRIGIYAVPSNLAVKPESYVVVEADKGSDLGKVIQVGSAFMDPQAKSEVKNVLRTATAADMQTLNENREKEEKAVRSCKEKILKHKLNMNLVDAEYQLDHNKLTFYFTSDDRVDFRSLVRDLASQYRTRIELRQIGVRDAARHIDSYGSCGCQLCCTVFLKKFENITTQYIKDQLIPTNPSRLTGICGRLKCCLSFERDYYIDELNKYPTVGTRVRTPAGKGYVEKIDIFNGVIYVRLKDEIEKFPIEEIRNELVNA
ncbi:MAG: hypothetical protein KDH97_06685 [Calditrichaeota bacterium]|nr:hypothetical protein [Calditrichota bacterium]MCB0289927.1 hypothetical protein [Calditrichota bacterium]MCB0303616.1 hypothetical protein [Calditrichota bacterium]MCB0314168.1 hypothetical protein [Calditrichota bacterium]MCB9086859.1 hypothetical protein [Calditrichia bacterium]